MHRVGQQPGFWLLCGLVFLVNALFSAVREEWVLAVLQTGTGVMASLAALASFNQSPERERGRRFDAD